MNHIVSLLRQFKSPDVFNPWSDNDPLDAFPGGADQRVERLKAHFDCKPALILIGEAPGYQGCHFSGVAFTNEKLILQGDIPRISSVFPLTRRQPPWSEPSATIVWGALRKLGIADRTVLWNTFAWHPHKSGNSLSNRTPTKSELAAGAAALRAVIKHFAGVPLVPVGRVAECSLGSIGVRCLPQLRHPAFGGANEFRAGLAGIVSQLRL